MNNDEKIKNLLSEIENKHKSLGQKPASGSWKTNGVINGTNINTINSIDKCVAILTDILAKSNSIKEACKLLGIDDSVYIAEYNDACSDITKRASVIKWDLESKKLKILEEKLKDLRSQDLKTEDALSDIAKMII